MSCSDCERYKLSASMWRNEAYKHAGTPLPWEPEELLRKEYQRGYADAMGWKTQNHLEHLPLQEERNFCSRCGKRTADLTVIHTCTPPPQENT